MPLALAAVLALFPALFPGEIYYIGLGFLTFIFVTLAVSWNMLGGYAGQISFGYAAFFGTAAYVTAILWSRYGWEPVYTLPVAGLASVGVALLVGIALLPTAWTVLFDRHHWCRRSRARPGLESRHHYGWRVGSQSTAGGPA